MLHSQACDGADSSDQDIDAQWGKLQVIVFSKTCYPNATRGRQAARCAFPTSPCGGSFGPASRRCRVTTPVATPQSTECLNAINAFIDFGGDRRVRPARRLRKRSDLLQTAL